MKQIYDKWDSSEDTKIAFEAVKNGVWDLHRFEAWISQVKLEEYRNATADENM